MRMHISREQLRRQIRRDADLDTDAGMPIQDPRVLGLFVNKDEMHGGEEADSGVIELKHARVLDGELYRVLATAGDPA